MDTYSKHTVFQVLICAVEKVSLDNMGENARCCFISDDAVKNETEAENIEGKSI